MATQRTTEQLANEIVEQLDEKYDLVYVDHGDRLTEWQVAAIVKGDDETLWEATEEFESEGRHQSVKEIIERDAKDIVNRWEREDDRDYAGLLGDFDHSDDWERVQQELWDRDSGSWVRDLINGTPAVLLRISVLDEDHGYDHVDVQPEQVLTDVGLPVTEQNAKIMADTLAECSPGFSVLLGYWIVGADVGDLYDLNVTPEAEVEIVNPHLYLGNPFSGSGWISEEPFEGIVRVKREDLRTDKDAFGYSVDNIYGGLNASSYSAEIRTVENSKEPA
jgi:hypothetical protein